MSTYDLAVMGGIVVDGSGLARRRGDVAVKDGKIAKIGFVDPAEADEVIDADGLHVAPGIVDAHTHYDPQLTFEPYATSSCYHGVTTVLAGNCGFSVAPNLPDQRDFLARMFARVEGMSPVALSAVDWAFESFARVLEEPRVEARCEHGLLRRPLGHPPDGHEGGRVEREATAGEIEQMRKIVADAMEAGAAGFSSSHGPTQLDGDDVPVPSRFASMEELEVLCREAGHHRGGSLSYLHRSSIGGLDAEDKELLFRLGTVSRLPIILQGLGGRSKVDVPGADWDSVVQWIEESGREGVGIYSLLRNHPFDRDFDFVRGTNLYEGVPSWHPVRQGRTFGRGEACAAPRRGPARRDAQGGREPQQGRCEGLHPAPARVEGRVRGRGDKARARQVPEPVDRRHRLRAGGGARRRDARPGGRREAADGLSLREQEPHVGGGRRSRPEAPGDDHRRLGRRCSPGPRRRCGLVDRCSWRSGSARRTCGHSRRG